MAFHATAGEQIVCRSNDHPKLTAGADVYVRSHLTDRGTIWYECSSVDICSQYGTIRNHIARTLDEPYGRGVVIGAHRRGDILVRMI